MTAAVIPLPRRHGAIHATIPQPSGSPDFHIGDTPHGVWAGRPQLSTSHIPTGDVPHVIRGLLTAIDSHPDADTDLVDALLGVLALYGYTDGDDVA